MGSLEGLVSDIQRFSIHDGPGIRTTVFLKGCSMRCFWCHNPETLRARRELQFFPAKCIGCAACADACPEGAHAMEGEVHVFHRERCRSCGSCAEVCYAQALVMVGDPLSTEGVMQTVLRDKPFYDNSGGGMTLSGGEPLLQREFSHSLLKAAKREGIHTAIETNAFAPWEEISEILPAIDLLIMDIKAMDPALHREGTGVSNAVVLENAAKLSREDIPLIIRTPVVPGYNDGEEEISGIASFIRRFPNLRYYELLPYHPLGESKYRSLGLAYRAADIRSPDAAVLERLRRAAGALGLPVR